MLVIFHIIMITVMANYTYDTAMGFPDYNRDSLGAGHDANVLPIKVKSDTLDTIIIHFSPNIFFFIYWMSNFQVVFIDICAYFKMDEYHMLN